MLFAYSIGLPLLFWCRGEKNIFGNFSVSIIRANLMDCRLLFQWCYFEVCKYNSHSIVFSNTCTITTAICFSFFHPNFLPTWFWWMMARVSISQLGKKANNTKIYSTPKICWRAQSAGPALPLVPQLLQSPSCGGRSLRRLVKEGRASPTTITVSHPHRPMVVHLTKCHGTHCHCHCNCHCHCVTPPPAHGGALD